jgi:hypothetical protein
LLYFITGRLSIRVASKTLFASFKKLFAVFVIQVLVDPLTPTQLCDRGLTP